MDGYQVAQRLRQEHAPEHMLLVAATGYGPEERSRHATFDHNLTKPIDTDDLEAIFFPAWIFPRTAARWLERTPDGRGRLLLGCQRNAIVTEPGAP